MPRMFSPSTRVACVTAAMTNPVRTDLAVDWEDVMRAPHGATVSTRPIAVCLFGLLVVMWVAPTAGESGLCCICLDASNKPCPSGSPQCFTVVGSSCLTACGDLGCSTASGGGGFTCGFGTFADCAMIDGTPVKHVICGGPAPDLMLLRLA